MKLVREQINEKFTQDSDPIKDMGIGLYVHRIFKSRNDMYEWLSENLPAILGTKSIPKNILNDPHPSGYMIHHKYIHKLIKYVDKYIKTENDYLEGLFPGLFADFLQKKYPYLIRK